MTPQPFVDKWRLIDRKERSVAPTHFNDPCAVPGVPAPLDADPTAQDCAFDRGAVKPGSKIPSRPSWKPSWRTRGGGRRWSKLCGGKGWRRERGPYVPVLIAHT